MNTKQQFLLSFFDQDEYQEKEVNGFWLVKQFNSNSNKWQVAIYTQESFQKYKDYNYDLERKKEFQYLLDRDK